MAEERRDEAGKGQANEAIEQHLKELEALLARVFGDDDPKATAERKAQEAKAEAQRLLGELRLEIESYMGEDY